MQNYSVLIIGAGQIGATFDAPGSSDVLSHAHAFTSHPGFRLLGFVDADLARAERAAESWGGKGYQSLAEVEERIDVAVVAVPDQLHFAVLREVAGYPVQLVLAEKPLAQSESEAEEILALYRERGVPLAVNYSRRYVADFQALAASIRAGELGRFITGTGYYGKGTLHNGSHLVDLLRLLLGEISRTSTISAIRDWREDDPSCSALLEFACGGSFLMQPVDCREFTIFEMELLFEAGRVRIVDAGFAIELQRVQQSPVFAGYRVLSPATRRETGLKSALAAAAEAVYRHLAHGTELPCDAEDGLAALRICSAIIRDLA